MTHLLGTDHFNEPSTPVAKQDSVLTPTSPSVQLTPQTLTTSDRLGTAQAPIPDPKLEGKAAELDPKPETKPAEVPATTPVKGGKRSSKISPTDEVPPSPTESISPPLPVNMAGARLKATKIVDDQFHIEHIYENPEVTSPKKEQRQTSPSPLATGASTPEATMPTAGEDVGAVVTGVPLSVPVPVDTKLGEIPSSAPASVSAPVVAPPPSVTLPHLNYGGGENHPKVPWSVKVPLDMYDFIREHDNYRPFLKDQRPFREKFLEWVEKMRTEASPELVAAQEAAAKVRSGPSDPSPSARGATMAPSREPTL